MLRPILLYALTFLFFTYCSGQEPTFLHITQNEGLPSNTIYDIYRDSKGFLWIGTDNGVLRFNGIEFEKFSTFDGLPDNEIFFFQEDYEHRLWTSTFNGQLCYFKEGVFHNSDNTAFLKLPFSTSDTKFIKLHADSSLSIAFFNQPNFFINIKGNSIQRINIKGNNSNDIQCILKPSCNNYEFFTSSNYISTDSNGTLLDHKSIKTPYQFSYTQNTCYLIKNHSIFNNKQLVSVLPYNSINSITRVLVADGETFVCTRSGLYINKKLLLRNQKISSITRDLSGNYWIGTLNDGIYILKADYVNYNTYKNAYSGVVKYCTANAWGMYFSTSANRLYGLKNNTSSLLYDYAKLYKLKKELAYYSVHHIDTTNFYCFSGLDVFIAPYKKRGTQPDIYYHVNSSPKHVIQQDNIVYLLSSTTISYINSNKKNTDAVSIYPTDKNARLFWMSPDINGDIWYTGTNGIYTIKNELAVPQTQFKDLHLKWFDIYKNRLIGITTNNRLILAENIYGNQLKYRVIQDDCIWNRTYQLDSIHFLVSTNKLYRLITITGRDSADFTISPIDNEFIPRDAECIYVDSNTTYFFKNEDIYTVRTKSLLSGIQPPIVWVASLKTTRNTYNVLDNPQIPYKEAQNITINFETLSFDTKHIQYEYAVTTGNDTFWHTTTNEEINIYTPTFGTYNIKVRAVTQSGVYSKPYIFSFTVLKPFYATWAFIISCSILLIAIIAIAIRLRIHSLLAKREQEHEIKIKFLKSEYKALNALMNPHFIFNSLNNIQGFINKGNKLSANNYLNTFSKLVRQNMHNVSKETIVLKEEIELIQHYLVLEKMRFKDHFNYQIDIHSNVDINDVFIPPLLIQPFIENAIKHGLLSSQSTENMLWVRFYTVDSLLYVEIEDNGIGFNEYPSGNSGHTSYALNNIRTRVSQLNEMHNNAIHLEIANRANNQGGTKVTITLDTDALS
jgi:hypothetical protein